MAGNIESAREASPTRSDLAARSRSRNSVSGYDASSSIALLTLDSVQRGRAASPALSDASTVTILSRSPSPVPGYDVLAFQFKVQSSDSDNTHDRPRDDDGRFMSVRAKRACTPDMER